MSPIAGSAAAVLMSDFRQLETADLVHDGPMATQPYRLAPIDPTSADALRARGGPSYVADDHPGYPCRQCLRDAEVGEELILGSHDPFTVDTPYRSASPIFLHREPCEFSKEEGALPGSEPLAAPGDQRCARLRRPARVVRVGVSSWR